ncbi:F510_1955 family glycosylhydrolase [Actinomadura sp. CNU-125]|uniref:F510_1955 family glycosylhydrolase n=1 Tax=Actinomadura sp. CNU-125 TaxID=1904961 RepID=UPI00117781C5|nr:sialidase family protein [Actinomadura sp. CNU-125]
MHAVAVDPADESIYVAAHNGLFKIESPDRAMRVADNRQDTMGFTVIGPRTFLASGHPAPADAAKGAPPHLGLMRSTDAGRTWTSVSEAGEADFHSLQQAGSTLYGYDSQTASVRRSEDSGRTWTDGARVEANDLAAHEREPERLYAATSQGVQVSEDSGATFEILREAPDLTHLDVLDDGTLIGVAPDGRIQIGAEEEAWRSPGQIADGQVSAFTAVDGKHFLVAGQDGTVHESRDGGRTFDIAYRAE